jgi:hypothetical protein
LTAVAPIQTNLNPVAGHWRYRAFAGSPRPVPLHPGPGAVALPRFRRPRGPTQGQRSQGEHLRQHLAWQISPKRTTALDSATERSKPRAVVRSKTRRSCTGQAERIDGESQLHLDSLKPTSTGDYRQLSANRNPHVGQTGFDGRSRSHISRSFDLIEKF